MCSFRRDRLLEDSNSRSAKMEFHYSVGKEKRGEAQSVNFHDLAMDSGDDLDSDTDDSDT
jgi:hypothetical protein